MAILTSRKVTKRFGGLTAVSQFDIEVKERSIHSIIMHVCCIPDHEDLRVIWD